MANASSATGKLVNLGERLKAIEEHLTPRLPLLKDLTILRRATHSDKPRPLVESVDEKQFVHPLRVVEWGGFFDIQAKVQYDVITLLGQQDNTYRLPSFTEPADGYAWGSTDVHAIQVEHPILEIIEKLKATPYGEQFHVGNGLLFKRHINSLAENGSEVQARRQDKVIFPNAIPDDPKMNGLRMVYRLRENDTTLDETTKMNNPGDLLYLYDLRALEDMSMNQIQAGMKAMEVAVKWDIVPPKSQDAVWFGYLRRTKHVIDAVNRIYQYMLEAGLSFGYITNGPSFVFLYINWNDPTTLRYKVIEPGVMADHHVDSQLYCHPAMQVLAFSLYSLTKQAVGQDKRYRAIAQLQQHPPIPPKLFIQYLHPHVLHTPTLEGHFARRAYLDMDMNPFTRIDDMQQADDDGYGTHIPQLQYPSREVPIQLEAWCTQKCLQGLQLGQYMDPMCPNYPHHLGDRHKNTNASLTKVSHPKSYKDWITGMAVQLGRTLDEGITALNKQTNRMVYFQVIDLRHRYVLLAKATAAELYVDVVTEQLAYFSARDLQGIDEGGIPVHLGSINLLLQHEGAGPYFADHRTYLNHFTFFSWSGTPVINTPRPTPNFPFKKIAKAFHTALMNLQNRNLAHGNIKPSKFLWDVSNDKFYLADLSKALIGKRSEIYMTKEELGLDINNGFPFDPTKDWMPNHIPTLDWTSLEASLSQSIHPDMDFLEEGGLTGLMMQLYAEVVAAPKFLDTGYYARELETAGESSGQGLLRQQGFEAFDFKFSDFVHDGDFVLNVDGGPSARAHLPGKEVNPPLRPGQDTFMGYAGNSLDEDEGLSVKQVKVDLKGKGVDRRS